MAEKFLRDRRAAYRFSAWRRAENIAVPRRSVLARVLWRDEAGNEVKRLEGVVTNFSRGVVATAEPEYPRESGAGNDVWVELSGVYEAPPGATQARVELHLLWAPNGKVEWSDVAFLPTEAPVPRKVRLASVHYVRVERRRRWPPAANSRRSSKTLHAAKPTSSCRAKP